MRHFRIIAYDITDNRRRRSCLRRLRAISEGYQDSVFECLLSKQEWQHVLAELRSDLDPGDSLLMAVVGSPSRHWQLGLGPVSPRAGLVLIL